MKKSTQYAKPGEIERKWVLIDADRVTLGRLATKAAMILRGKDKPQFTPNSDTGDFVVIINADKVVLTGVKADKKEYWRYSGWLGGLHFESFKEAMAKLREMDAIYADFVAKVAAGRGSVNQFGPRSDTAIFTDQQASYGRTVHTDRFKIDIAESLVIK